ncbi:MAG: hypothetical protein AB3N16_05300 [Flavobacteriaceae bacterium]
MRYLILLVALASLGSIAYGSFLLEENPSFAHKCIGFGTAGLFLLAMPLFLMTVGKGKKWKDYMLNEENIKKMRENQSNKDEIS